jgi:hypothetical protein
VEGFALQMSIIVLLEQIKSHDFRDKVVEMSQLPLKHKNYIICLFNLEYGGIQNGQFYT